MRKTLTALFIAAALPTFAMAAPAAQRPATPADGRRPHDGPARSPGMAAR
ncbi:periplasmic inhibitor/zinc-resistance associated protein [Pseudomonas aeruginosa]|nr:periplasmic inhibitor/zinc-resistance associated protein [Pseudomonas aeruginosa]